MKERGKERYSWRAGVMSRNEREEGRGTLCVDGCLVVESPFLVKNDGGERGHAC